MNFEIPKSLDTKEFRESWSLWMEYRMGAKKKPINPLGTFKMHLRKLESFGHDGAILAIETAINKGWQGIFKVEPYKPWNQRQIESVSNRDEEIAARQREQRQEFKAPKAIQVDFNPPPALESPLDNIEDLPF